MAKRFEKKSVFITGASSGIGAAVAQVFAQEGARVALAARRADRLDETRKAVEDAGGEALALTCDVHDRASINAAVAQTADTFGGIDVCLANAGWGVTGRLDKLETDDFRRVFETNVFGLVDTMYAALPYLKESKGRLGFVGSIMGRMSMPAAAPYTASKFAVVGIGETAWLDLRRFGISVTLINPGMVESEIRRKNKQGEVTDKPDPAPGFFVMRTDKAARQIVSALYRRKPEAVITGHGKLAVFLGRHFPRTTRTVFRLAGG